MSSNAQNPIPSDLESELDEDLEEEEEEEEEPTTFDDWDDWLINCTCKGSSWAFQEQDVWEAYAEENGLDPTELEIDSREAEEHLEECQERYQGSYSSKRAWAEEQVGDEIPKGLQYYFNWDSWIDDQESSYNLVEYGGKVYVFSA